MREFAARAFASRALASPQVALRHTGGWVIAWLTAAATVLLLVVVPLMQLISAAVIDGREAVRGLADARLASAIFNTVWTSGVVTVLAVGVAGAAAWVTERGSVPGRAGLRLGMLLPLLIPPYVSALSWARAYGSAGLSDRLLGVEVPGVYGPAGVVTVLTIGAIPLAYAVLAGALASRAEPDMERAARISGATGWTAVRTVTLPLLRPGLLAASALVFLTSVNAFGVPAVLGTPAGFTTVTTRIYADLVRSADLVAFSRVLVLTSGLVAVAVVVVVCTEALVGTAVRGVRTGAPTGSAVQGPRRWLPAMLIWGYLLAVVIGPLVALGLLAVSRAVGLPPTPSNWTMANITEALGGPARAALVNSVVLALAASVGAVLLGGLLAGLGRRREGRTLGTTTVLTLAVPGSALAVAVLLAYGGRLRDTLSLILIAYLAKFLAIGHRSIAGALDGLPPDLLRAARSSGATATRATWSVSVPLLRPAIAAGALVVFLFALHEVTISALLVGPGTQTLGVVILNHNQLGEVLISSALALVLTVLTAVVIAPAFVLRRRAGNRRSP